MEVANEICSEAERYGREQLTHEEHSGHAEHHKRQAALLGVTYLVEIRLGFVLVVEIRSKVTNNEQIKSMGPVKGHEKQRLVVKNKNLSNVKSRFSNNDKDF